MPILIRIRASACLFFFVGALSGQWPAPAAVGPGMVLLRNFCGLANRRNIGQNIATDALVLAGHLVRGQGTPHATGQRAPTEKKRQDDARILLGTLHTRSPYDRTHHSHVRCVHSHRPNASSGPRELSFGHIDGRRLAAGTIRESHGSLARGSSRMSLCTLRARVMKLISRGMGQNLRRSARATYLENAYGSATQPRSRKRSD